MDDFRPVDPDRIRALVDELGASPLALTPILAPAELGRLSADFHDYSPVLEPLLKGRCAQLAVKVERPEQVMAVAGACARHRVPLTLRGAGTGNYGQCVPLAGGLVLDLGGLDRLRSVDPDSGVVEAEPGCILAQLDGQLAVHGRALRLAPSTYRSATLGGFIAGGSGGLGSLRWGFLRDPGHLLGLEVVTLEAEPRLLRLDAAASAPLNHAYGTNGIITALRLASTEAVAWRQVVVGFSRWEAALEVSRELPTTALPLVRWQGPQALADLVAQCRELGAVPFDPHVITVEDGGLGVVDADQVAAKAAYDPAGLMNPGKLRGWVG